MNKKVYDVTAYLEEHPGGVGKIMEFAGKDATEAFIKQQHSQEAEKISKQYYIGEVEESSNMMFVVLGLLILTAAVYFFLKWLMIIMNYYLFLVNIWSFYLSQVGNSTFGPVGRPLLCWGSYHHYEVCWMSCCAQDSSSFLRFVQGSFVCVLVLEICYFSWFEAYVGARGEELSIFSFF